MLPIAGPSVEENTASQEEQIVHEPGTLVRIPKNIIVDERTPEEVDDRVVAFNYYNCFNYSLLSAGQTKVNLTAGITSSHPGEGKTLVACNLAASLAMGYERDTVLVDLNIEKPRLHEIFGAPLGPGLVEAMQNGSVHLSKTNIKHLCVLSAGQPPNGKSGAGRSGGPAIGLNTLAAFRDVIRSLEQRYEFVIVDMPALQSRSFPILYANELNGLVVVVDTKRTRREDLDKIMRQVHERQVLGFVFNRFADDI